MDQLPPPPVHIVHRSASWRAKLAFMIRGMGHHAEIYEGFVELIRQRPSSGVLLLEGDLAVGLWHDGPALRSLHASVALPYIVFDPYHDADRAFQAGRGGASGYLAPEDLETQLPHMVLRAAADTHASDARRVAIRSRQLMATLTRRELEVLEYITQGLKNKDIGRKLGVSHRTVEIHRFNALQKLKATSVAHATRMFLMAQEIVLAA